MTVRHQGFQQTILHSCYQWLSPVAFLRVCQGWIQENSYLNKRDSRAKRGVRANSPAWSEPPKQVQCRYREAER